MRVYIRLIAVLVSLTMLLGCSKLTVANFKKIKMGSEYDAVVGILGKPDNCSEALVVRNCVWGDEQKNITVNFVGDKVILSTSKNIR